jgi:mannose-6-phosphate isomerase-like protein (cupin superfamily)
MPATVGSLIPLGRGKAFRFGPNNGEVKASEAAGLRFGFLQSTFPKGGGMPFLHVHHSYEEAFSVVEGTIEFQLGDQSVQASSGSAILIPAGVPHCFRNVADVDARIIVMAAPARAIDMVLELGEAGRDQVDRMAEILERHDSALLERRPHWAPDQRV